MINMHKSVFVTNTIINTNTILNVAKRIGATIQFVENDTIKIQKDIFNVFLCPDLTAQVEALTDSYPDKAFFVWNPKTKKFRYCHSDGPDGFCYNCDKLLFRNEEAIAIFKGSPLKRICEDCYKDIQFRCAKCGDRVAPGSAWLRDDMMVECELCSNSNYQYHLSMIEHGMR